MAKINIQFVRLENDVCEAVNRLADAASRNVSELVNEVLREYLRRRDAELAERRKGAE
ncbi:MAG TPA: ribbon-helix-helix protein, CopG family [Bryobacteraceae bacterium]|nr:ribbon-helix-helix protein, CopG family [Bryobacteraceae bacterium]